MFPEAVLEFGEEKWRFVNEVNYRNTDSPRVDNVETAIAGEGIVPAKVLCFIKEAGSTSYNLFWKEDGSPKPRKRSQVFVLVHFYRVLNQDPVMGKKRVQLFDPYKDTSYMVLPFGAIKGHAFIVPSYGSKKTSDMFWDQIWT